MGKWTSEDATREVLAVLPLLNRIVGAEVRREAGEETTIGQFRVLAHLADGQFWERAGASPCNLRSSSGRSTSPFRPCCEYRP